ncbi:MAG: M20/M25/M40 family metallo-hydrolase, partial [Pseudomonadota bacterium]
MSLFIFCVHAGVSSATDFDALAYYKHLHANPELSFQESKTSKMLADTLEQAGYEVTRSVGGHGVVALLRNGEGPTVLMRADMDALPVAEQTDLSYASTQKAIEMDGREVSVMHACGHDVHMTVVIDAALTMLNRREDWQGTLMVIMQPAEERGAGARDMLADGLFKRFPEPDFNISLHTSATLPAGQVGYIEGWMMANVDMV